MAVYRIFPEKDTFIFSETLTGNAGKDEIIEIGGYSDISGAGHTSRVLLQYSTTEIEEVLATKIQGASYRATINLYLADAYQIPVDYTLYAYPIYATIDWDNGKGKYGDVPVDTSGVSWTHMSAGQQNEWILTAYPTGVTGSYKTGYEGGGSWYTVSNGEGVQSSETFKLNSSNDVNLDVTTAVAQFVTGALDNRGFIIKLPNTLEFNTTSSIRLKYYGADTNTIYPPFLQFKWDDSNYSTGSLSVLNNSQSTITITNNKGKYPDVGKQRFRIASKPKYPARVFSTVSTYLTNYALPSGSYWGLRDENTEEMVVDFDEQYTKVSCDSTGPFFDVYMDGLQPERYYRILIKTELDGSTVVVDNQNIFKVVRNG